MRLPNSITTQELARLIGCQLVGKKDLILKGINTLEEAGPDELSFVANPRYTRVLSQTQAGAVIVSPDVASPPHITRLESENPYLAFQKATAVFFPPYEIPIEEGIHQTAVVHHSAKLENGVRVGAFVVIESGVCIGEESVILPFAYVGKDVTIGSKCIIGVRAVLRQRVSLGNRVVIGDGTVIGYDGFGYAPTPEGFRKIPQIGTVIIEDDVEIGANACVDRATLGETRIGKGTKIDNLVQIAHNVCIGENSAIAAQVGISGSTHIGSRVLIGGQAGLVGHIDIGDDMIIGAQAGVTKSFDIKGMISGYPARPQGQAMKVEAALQHLPQLIKRIKDLEKALAQLQQHLSHHSLT